jgi:hypothetical protein
MSFPLPGRGGKREAGLPVRADGSPLRQPPR